LQLTAHAPFSDENITELTGVLIGSRHCISKKIEFSWWITGLDLAGDMAKQDVNIKADLTGVPNTPVNEVKFLYGDLWYVAMAR
jgi:hypothetical protein